MNWIDNNRYLTGWRKALWVLFGNAQSVRRLIGGRWENWWTDVVNRRIWYPVNQPGSYLNRPAPSAAPSSVWTSKSGLTAKRVLPAKAIPDRWKIRS
jgi:hypothetical protein